MLLNHDPERQISKQLYKLSKYSLNNNENQKNIKKIAEYVAKIHVENMSQYYFKIYDAKWVMEQTGKIKDIAFKKDVMSALEIMYQIEVGNSILRKNEFLAWDIIHSTWQKDYQAGRVGSYVWDIASILNSSNDPHFSEIFLESYLKHVRVKPTLTALYANLYYVKVFEALKNKNFENIIGITREIINNGMFSTDVISYETLLKLKITVY